MENSLEELYVVVKRYRWHFIFFLLYCCLVVGKRSDRKLADYEEREEQKTSKDTAKKLGADIWEKQE
ncbi:MAG: hypothetical protein ACLSFA_15550 [Roseburia inulinivorans]